TDLFLRGSVVIHEHLAGADDGSAPNLVWVEPAHMNERDYAVAEVEGEQRDILSAIAIVTLSLAAHRQRRASHQQVDDRYIVSGKIPRHVDVALEESQVCARGTDIEHVTQRATIQKLLDFPHRRAVLERVSDH